MMAASFMPMVLKYVLPRLSDHLMKVFKLDKMLKYMELPNEADIAAENALKKCEEIQYELNAMKEVLKELDKKLG